MVLYWMFQNQYDNLKLVQDKGLYYKKQLIIELLTPVIADIYYWSRYDFSENDFDPDSNYSLKEDTVDFIAGMDNYSQFRLINTNGKEVLRLNRNEDGQIIKDNYLQDKSKSNYFKESINLNQRQIYLSPLNLNIENGIVEVPYKPMIRGCAVITSKEGKKLGIVVINFNTEKLLEILKKDNDFSFLLIDEQGNYLAADNIDKEFSHLILNQEKHSFTKDHQEIWETLNKSKENSFVINRDLWIKTELDFRKELSSFPIFKNENADINTSNKWILLNHITYKQINEELNNVYLMVLLFNFLSMLAIIYMTNLEFRNEKSKNKYLESLRVVNKKLEVRNKQLKEYNNIVAHNLRAPSTSISALVNMLKETKNFKEAEQFFPKLSKVTSAINILIDDLLVYVRVLNNDEIKIEKIDLEDTIKKTLDLFMETLDSEIIEIKYDLIGWNSIKFSKIYMQSILQNLISNAIKYRNKEKKSYIYLNTKIIDDKKILTISDNGLGINLERHSKDLFKLYKRFHRDISGKGLGLFLVKTQLESLGAKIEVKSTVNKGTDFIITFN